jgi:hypothetical protein
MALRVAIVQRRFDKCNSKGFLENIMEIYWPGKQFVHLTLQTLLDA